MGTGKPSGDLAEIQPCGFMVVLGQDWRVAHVSGSIADHFADCAPFMPGQPLAEFFGAAAVHSLRNQLALMRSPQGTARLFSLYFAAVPKPFDVSMHFHDGHIILEALPAARLEAGDPSGTVRQMAEQLDSCDNLTEILQRGARCLRALTGFDSVRLFRIDHDGQAVLAAEDSRGDAGGAVRCPPPETRILADADSRPSRLEPAAPRALIARSLLRSWTTEEADESDAGARLAVPMSSAGVPWGVAVCVSRSARHQTLERIAAAELFADLLAMRAELSESRARAHT